MKPLNMLRWLTLGLTASLVGVALTAGSSFAPASAQTTQADPVRAVTWDITSLGTGGGTGAQSNYNTALTQLRNLVSHPYRNNVRELNSDRYVVRLYLRDNGRRVASLYFWSDNLYLVGFRDDGNNVYHFRDVDGADLERRLGGGGYQFTTLSYTGSYTNIPGGSDRNLLSYNASRVFQAFQNLGNFNASGGSTYTNSLLRAIRVTAESARNGHIARGMADSFSAGEPAERFVHANEIENGWSRISTWVRNETQNPTTNSTLNIAGRQIDTFSQLASWSPMTVITKRS